MFKSLFYDRVLILILTVSVFNTQQTLIVIVIILFLYAGSFLEEGGFSSLNCLFSPHPPFLQ
jgi:hypothetical protein